jgi:tetratricopeptide (TPR) repeat protein
MRAFLVLACIAAVSRADDPVQAAAAMIERYRKTGDGAFLAKGDALVAGIETPPARRVKLLLATFRHEFPAVEAGARELVAANPRDLTAWALLGDARMELGRYDEAGEAYRRLVGRRINAEGASRIAWHRFVTGKPEEALRWMQLAVQAGAESDSAQAWLWTELAEMQWKLDQPGDARHAAEQAVRLAPESHRAHAVLARILWPSDARRAQAEMERALAIVPLAEYAAELALRETDPEAAERRWKYAEGLEKIARAQGEKANRVLAVLYADARRNLDRALELAEAEYEVRNDVYSHDARAWVLHRLGRHAEAKTWMDQALALGTPEPSFRRHAAAIAKALEAPEFSAAR